MTLVERVARAIDAQAFAAFDKHGRQTIARDYALRQARAALAVVEEVMREPSETMTNAGIEASPMFPNPDRTRAGRVSLDSAEIENVWHTMAAAFWREARGDGGEKTPTAEDQRV